MDLNSFGKTINSIKIKKFGAELHSLEDSSFYDLSVKKVRVREFFEILSVQSDCFYSLLRNLGNLFVITLVTVSLANH